MPNGSDDESAAGPFRGPAESATPISPVRRIVGPYLALPTAVHILCLGSFINRAGSFVVIFLTIYVSTELGYGVQFAANCFGVFGLGSIIASLVGGQLADRFGRKPIMLTALFGTAVILLLLGTVSNRWAFLTVIFLLSLIADLYRPAASAMMGDLVNTDERPLAFGLMYIAFNLGFAVAAPIGGLLAAYSFSLLFVGDALTTTFYALIVVFFIRETLPSVRTEGSTGSQTVRPRATWGDAVRHISGDSIFLLFSLATLFTSIVFMQAFSTLPIYMKQMGFEEDQVGWLLSTNGFLIVLTQIPFTQMLSRFNRVLMILFGEILIAVGFGLTTFAETAPMFLMTIVIWTLGEVIQAAFKQSMVADLAPTEMRARYMGVFSLCHAVGLTVGAPLGGRVLDELGPRVLWSGCFVVVMMAAAVYCVVYIKLQQTRRKPALASSVPK